jgi:hypothetical protein
MQVPSSGKSGGENPTKLPCATNTGILNESGAPGFQELLLQLSRWQFGIQMLAGVKMLVQ